MNVTPIKTKFEAMMDYIKQAIKSFDDDHPDTPYQQGYLAALEELERVASTFNGVDR